MKKTRTVLLGAVVAVAAVLICRWLFPSNEKLIRKVLTEAVQAASWNAGQGALDHLAGARRLASCCTADVEVQLDVAGIAARSIHGADELQQLAAATRTSVPSCQVELSQISVTVGSDRQTATVQLVATARVSGSDDPIIQEVRMELRKVERAWRIARVEPVRGFGM